MAAHEAVPKPPVQSHLLRQLMEQPRRLPPAFVDVGDGTSVTTSVQLQLQTNLTTSKGSQ